MERKTAGSGFGARLVSSERYGEDMAGYCTRGRRVAAAGTGDRQRACGVYEIKGGDRARYTRRGERYTCFGSRGLG